MKLQKLLKGRRPESSLILLDGNTLHMDRIPFRTPVSAGHDHLQQPASTSRILRPAHMDVLFGRGKPYQSHPGNNRLHEVVELCKDRYSQARRHVKTEIAQEIVDYIKVGCTVPGRFLKRVEGDGTWAEVSDDVARDKVSHALRGKPRKDEKGIGEKRCNSHAGDTLAELKNTKRSAYDQEAASSAAIADASLQQAAKKRRTEDIELDLLALASRGSNGMMRHFGTSAVAGHVNSGRVASSSTSTGIGSVILPLDLHFQRVAAALTERHLTMELSLRGLLHPPVASNPFTRNELSIQSTTFLQSLRNNGHARVQWY